MPPISGYIGHHQLGEAGQLGPSLGEAPHLPSIQPQPPQGQPRQPGGEGGGAPLQPQDQGVYDGEALGGEVTEGDGGLEGVEEEEEGPEPDVMATTAVMEKLPQNLPSGEERWKEGAGGDQGDLGEAGSCRENRREKERNT